MTDKKRYRLPKVLNLGRGYLVKIRVVPSSELKELADIEPDEHDAIDGLWDDDTLTIYISRELTTKKKWEVYWHEIIHAVNDISAVDASNLRP